MGERFLRDRVELLCGDCREQIATLADDSIDAVVTDPPYSLTSIVKRFGPDGSAAPKEYEEYAHKGRNPYLRASQGFMGQRWDTGEVAFDPEFWAEVLRVLKPGGHVLAMGGTRTYHRLVCAIEDAGFEIRDCVMWVYGSGFPKSHDVSKGIDRAAGAAREVVETGPPVKRMIPGADQNKAGWEKTNGREYVPNISEPATSAARQWQGWGTALKPSVEPCVLARKPLSEGTIAANVLEHGTGALNIDACRIEGVKGVPGSVSQSRPDGRDSWRMGTPTADMSGRDPNAGRWPANLILSVPEDEYELKAFTSSEQKRELFRWLSENA